MTELRVRDTDSTRILAICRPERRNALNLEVVGAITGELREPPESVRAFVLTGEGEHFCAGADADTAVEGIDSGQTEDTMRVFHAMMRALRACDRPVIAAVFGSVYGGAFNLALACDLIVAARDAAFCQVFLRLGIVPDLGGAYLLSRAIGYQRAIELALSTRPVPADEAQSLGFVNQVFATRDETVDGAIALAEAIAKFSPEGVAQTLRLMRAGQELDFDGALNLEARIQSRLLQSEQVRARFAAVRKPRDT
jgi:2-(1,2-epoxy-1,2-dihydrophenyl)acetyl-CoA isomerase